MTTKNQTGKKIALTQIRSEIGRNPQVRATLRCLGLGRIGKKREHTVNPALMGIVDKVRHLLCVKEIN